ncbi:MAG TPA: hypothetical protein VEB43_14990 [Anaeromyxobacter sp.]|nr:hypothetical protein [Anaeromyxobacter sp.]
MRISRYLVAIAVGASLAACGGSTSQPGGVIEPPPPPPPPPPDTDPVVVGDWTYYGTLQGLSPAIRDVSADEAGNVYVAAGEALHVKRRTDSTFLRFDSSNAGLTVNCNDRAEVHLPVPTKPFWQCNILSVAGMAPGQAIIGFEGFTNEVALPGWDWVLATGGADVVSFDAEAGTLSRVRHVDIGSPPHTICGHGGEERGDTCDPDEYFWNAGRRLFHKVNRIVVNHDPGSGMYGDAWMCGEHGTFAVLLANAAARGYRDRTAGWGPLYADMKDVWEHLHPSMNTPLHPEWFVNPECTAMSIDPRSGRPWASNQIRTTFLAGYGPDLRGDEWWMGRALDLWEDPSEEDLSSANDLVHSMSHCADGTLWVGSLRYGLARIATDGTVAHLSVPGPGRGVSAVACDPLDGSLWVGLAAGGVTRLRNGAFEPVDGAGRPAFASHVVESIQLDRWASPRIVYFAFLPEGDAPGGVGAYAGQ